MTTGQVWEPKTQDLQDDTDEKKALLQKIKDSMSWQSAVSAITAPLDWAGKYWASKLAFPWTKDKPTARFGNPEPIQGGGYRFPPQDTSMQAYEQWESPWGVKGLMEQTSPFNLALWLAGGGEAKKVAGTLSEEVLARATSAEEKILKGIKPSPAELAAKTSRDIALGQGGEVNLSSFFPKGEKGIEEMLKQLYGSPKVEAILAKMPISERVALAKAANLAGQVGAKSLSKLSAEEKSALAEQLAKGGAKAPLSAGTNPAMKAPIVKGGGAGIPSIKPPPLTNVDDILNKFGDAIKSPKTERAFQAQQDIWATEKATRSAKFADLLAKERASGVDAKTAIDNATAAFRGEYSVKTTGLGLPQDVQDAAYSKIIKVITEDTSIPPAMKSFEIRSTSTALENALLGKPIPSIPGIKGGSAKARLLRIFESNPVIKDIIKNPEEMQRKLLESMVGPSQLDPATLDYLRNLPNIPFGQSIMGAKTTVGIVTHGTPEQIAQETLRLKLELAGKPRPPIRTPFPEEPLLTGQRQSTMFPEKSTVGTVTHGTKAEIEQGTLDLILELSGKPQGATGTVMPPDKLLKQFSMLPPDKRTLVINTTKSTGRNIVDALNIPRSILASGDISFGLRQGLVLGTRHPVEWGKQFARGIKALRSDEIAEKVNNLIMSDPDVMWGVTKGYLDPISLAPKSYMQGSESFASRIAEKIPIVRKLVKASGRSFAVSSNSLQTGVWKQGVKALRVIGADPSEYKELGQFVNWAVGRGTLPKIAQRSAPVLNATLFAPRLFFSRLELPTKLVSTSPYVRKQAWETLGTFLAFGGSMLALYSLGGGKVELDPRSSDFGKVTIGNTRLDLWSGYVQYIRFASQIMTGKYKDSLGQVKNSNRYDTMLRFFQSKDSPALGLLTDILKGTNYAGQSLSKTPITQQILDRILPLSWNDMIAAVQQEGIPVGIGLGTLSAMGVGIVTYSQLSGLLTQWKKEPAFKTYLSIPTDPNIVKSSGLISREIYREARPQIDAELFITGQVTSVRTPTAANMVMSIIQQNKIDPAIIPAVQTWQTEQKKRQELGLMDVSTTITDMLIRSLLNTPAVPVTPSTMQPVTPAPQPAVDTTASSVSQNPLIQRLNTPFKKPK